ncbi:MAG: ribosome small subunit-dependent GTPase A, partial [Vicingaceae bacterium]|nr:ribosome small subunit-dependent GTPase A [Vicingaceae bacterium]
FPAVGDWVAISEYDENKALIHAVFPRKSILERKAINKDGHTQIIATNIDVGLIVQSINRDFSINRLERYITICNASKIEPIIVLSKVDLIENEELKALLNQIKERITNISIYAISNQSQYGIDEIKATLIQGKTYCLLGSSGVGKSTLINTLNGSELMDTGEISERIDRGKHITTHRELFVLEDGGILIDNPGMREVGITDSTDGLEMTFEKIIELSKDCKFNDCKHTNENDCAVFAAIESGELDESSYENFLKMEKEKEHFESTIAEKRQKDKDFGKMIKHFKNTRKSNKF